MLLELQQVTKTYRTGGRSVTALDDVSLAIPAGRFLAIHGASGCGKSTLLLTAGGLLCPSSGNVVFDSRSWYALSAEQRAKVRAETVGFVFQQFHLIPYLSVLDNVLAARLGVPHRRTSMAEARSRALELLDRFGLAERILHTPAQLSVGERQRTALARALLNGPRLLLADEPTGNLDETSGAQVLEELARFAAAGGSVLLVTHDRRAAHYAHEVREMLAGKVLEPQPAFHAAASSTDS